LSAADGVLAVNLPRPDDWGLACAWLEDEGIANWSDVQRCLGRLPCAELLERGAMMGLAVAGASTALEVTPAWCRRVRLGTPAITSSRPPRVLDLSALWAGPLCGHLFELLGAEVIKVESVKRPDGARSGPLEFFDLLNGGKRSVAIDLQEAHGREQLRSLMMTADIVIESSRPRALRHMSILAEEVIASRTGMTWISITGYGRETHDGLRIAYGDDAAVAGGLSAALFASSAEWVICADAIADPLTGLHAALAGWVTWLQGGGCMLDISMVGVVQHCVAQPAVPMLPVVRYGTVADDWWILAGQSRHRVEKPYSRPVRARAAPLGADNSRFLSAY
jgi:hypothetical protein